MTYDEYLSQEQYKNEGHDCSKIWVVFINGEEVWDFSFEEDKLKYDFKCYSEVSKDKLEFGWVWENDFNPADLKETYRLLKVTENR